MHQIGVGVLGPVYRTYEPAADRLVAVKAFDLDLTPEQVQSLVEALNALVAADLSHRGIVSPLAAGLEDETPYLAQEYVAAESLDMAIRHYSPAPLDAALPFITGIAEAVDAAHERGVVHGALHLRDIFVSPDEVRITGFGVPSVLEGIGLAVPIRRPYTAPEVIAGRAWGSEADLFAVAAVAYELLTGRRAAGSGEQVAERLRDVTGVADPDALLAAFVTALADAPEERFSSGARFVSALRRAVGVGPQTYAADDAGTGDHADTTSDNRGEAANVADVVQEAPFSPSGDSPVPDLLAGLDLRQGKSSNELDETSLEPGIEDAPLEDAPVEDAVASAAPVGNPELESTDETATGWSDELDGADDPDEADESDEVADDVAETSVGPVGTGASNEYVPLEVFGAETDAPDSEAAPSEADGLSSLQPSDEDERRNDWEAEDPQPLDSASDDAGFDEAAAGGQAFDGFDDDDEDAASGSTDEYEEDDAAAPVLAGEKESSWLRGAVQVGVAALVVGVIAYFIGGLGSEEAAGDRVLEESGAGDAATAAVSEEPPEAVVTESVPPATPEAPSAEPPPPAVSPAPAPLARAAPPTPEPQAADAPAAPAAQQSADGGWLLFRTDPPGATVLLNGAERGVTPFSLSDVPFGQHVVQVSREGFVTATREVDVRPADPVVPVAVSLQPLDEPADTADVADSIGSLLVESRPPGASVLVDGEVVGVTPVAVPVPSGPHRVRMEREGYQVWSTTVEVVSAERVRVAASLDRIPR